MKVRNLAVQILPMLTLALLAPAPAAHAAAGTLKAAGTLTVSGDCRILTDAKGHKFALVGKLESLANGDQIQVTGKAAKKTSCLDGPAIQVEKVEKVKMMSPKPGDAPKEEPGKNLKIVTSNDGTLPPPPPGGPGGGAQVMMFHMNGTLIAGGTKCQSFRNLRGSVFNLTGDLKGFKTGDKVTLEGVGVSTSDCGPGPTVQVNTIQPIQQQ
jgi:hypothetical protein